MPSNRDAAQLILEVDARIATAQRAVNQLAKSIQQDSAGMEKSLEKVATSHARIGKAMNDNNGRVRAGFTQLSFQIGDVSQQAALGVDPMRIFAQQSGQVIQALQVMGGEGNKFLRFMGGPWGIAIATAAVVLGPLAMKLFQTGDETQKLVDKMREQARQAAINERANWVWEQSFDGLIEKSRKLREESEKSLQTEREVARARLEDAKATLGLDRQQKSRTERALRDARAELAEAERQLDRISSGALGGDSPGAVAGAEARVNAARDKVAKAAEDYNRATIAVSNATEAVDNLGVSLARVEASALADPIKEKFAALRKGAEDTIKDVDKLARRLAELDRQEKAAIEAAQQSNRGGLAKVTLSEVQQLLNSQFDLHPQRPEQLTKGKHAKNSYHYVEQAIDFVPKGGMGSISKEQVRALVEAAGVKILELLGPGDKGHDNHFHLAFAKQRLGPDQVAAAQAKRLRSGESDEQRAIRQENQFLEEAARLDQELLRAKQELVEGTDAQADAAIAALQAEQERRKLGYDNDAKEGKISAANAEILKAKVDQTTFEKMKAVELGRQLKHMERQSELEQRQFGYRIDDLRFADEMATTAAEQRRLQLEILDVVYQQREAALRELKARLELAGKLEEAADVQAQIDRLPTQRAQDTSRVLRGTMNPLEAWAASIPQSSAKIIEAFQEIQVRGLDSLANAITDVITGARSLGEAFGDMARSIVADIIQMTVRMLLFKAISGAIGGGAAGFFGGGGSLQFAKGGVFSRGEVVPFARGGIVDRPTFFPMAGGKTGLMGEAGTEGIFPIARDSMGRMGVRAVGAGRGRNVVELVLHSAPSRDAWAQVERISARTTAGAMPVTVKSAVNQTGRRLSRPKLNGR